MQDDFNPKTLRYLISKLDILDQEEISSFMEFFKKFHISFQSLSQQNGFQEIFKSSVKNRFSELAIDITKTQIRKTAQKRISEKKDNEYWTGLLIMILYNEYTPLSSSSHASKEDKDSFFSESKKALINALNGETDLMSEYIEKKDDRFAKHVNFLTKKKDSYDPHSNIYFTLIFIFEISMDEIGSNLGTLNYQNGKVVGPENAVPNQQGKEYPNNEPTKGSNQVNIDVFTNKSQDKTRSSRSILFYLTLVLLVGAFLIYQFYNRPTSKNKLFVNTHTEVYKDSIVTFGNMDSLPYKSLIACITVNNQNPNSILLDNLRIIRVGEYEKLPEGRKERIQNINQLRYNYSFKVDPNFTYADTSIYNNESDAIGTNESHFIWVKIQSTNIIQEFLKASYIIKLDYHYSIQKDNKVFFEDGSITTDTLHLML